VHAIELATGKNTSLLAMLDQIEMECRLICGSNKSTKGLQPPVESDCGGLQKKTTMYVLICTEVLGSL